MDKLAPVETVYAAHTFEAENPDEISFQAGEPIAVLEKDDMYGDGWWQGQNIHGQIGLFPKNYTSYEKISYSNQVDQKPVADYTLEQEYPQPYQARPLRPHTALNTISTISTLTTITNGHGTAELSRPASHYTSPPLTPLFPTKPTYENGVINEGDENEFSSSSEEFEQEKEEEEQQQQTNDTDGVSLDDEDSEKQQQQKQDNEDQQVEINEANDDNNSSTSKSMSTNSSSQPLSPVTSVIESRLTDMATRHGSEPQKKESSQKDRQVNLNGSNTYPKNFRQAHSLYHQKSASGSDISTARGTNLKKSQSLALKQQLQQGLEPLTDPILSLYDRRNKSEANLVATNGMDKNGNHSRNASVSSESSSNYDQKSPLVNPDHPSNWDIEQVCTWLREKGFDSLVNQFIENDITGDVLLDLSLDTLKELNIMSYGKRFKIMNALEELKVQYQIFDDEPNLPNDPMSERQLGSSNRHTEINPKKLKTNSTVPTTNKISPMYLARHSLAVTPKFNKGDSGNPLVSNGNNRFHRQSEQVKQLPPLPYDAKRNNSNDVDNNSSKANAYSILSEQPSVSNPHQGIISEQIPEEPSGEEHEQGGDMNNIHMSKARQKLLSRLGYFTKQNKQEKMHSINMAGYQRTPSTTGWDFLLEEEEKDIKEMERIEQEMESRKDRKLKDIRAVVRTASSRQRVHMSSPVPPRKTHADQNDLVDSQPDLPSSQRSPDILEIQPISNKITAPPVNLRQTPYNEGIGNDGVLPEIGVPDHEGWLKKQGEKYKTWKTRFCILKGVYLYYLKSNKIDNLSTRDPRIKGCINLTGYKIIPDPDIYPGKYGFKAVHETERPYFFANDDAEKTKGWMKAMMKATISRDMNAPVTTSCNIQTVPLPVAQKMNPRPSFTRPSSIASEFNKNAASMSSLPRSVSPTITALIYQSQNANVPPIAATSGNTISTISSSAGSPPNGPLPPTPPMSFTSQQQYGSRPTSPQGMQPGRGVVYPMVAETSVLPQMDNPAFV